MQTVTAEMIAGKKVLLRLDLDVPFEKNTAGALVVAEPFRLEAGMETLKLCLDHAESVIVMGHVGRPEGKVVSELSVAPIVEWFEEKLAGTQLPEGKFHILENLRFEPGEEACDPEFAKQLAALGDFYINEAFASHHPAASITVLPTLLPHAAGLRFAQEVAVLTGVIHHPLKPLVSIIGGAKIEDKLPVVTKLAEISDAVLIGGKLVAEIKEQGTVLPTNVKVASLSDTGLDISPESRALFQGVISRANQIVWAGPMGKYEDGQQAGDQAVIEAIGLSGADSIVGGGDTITAIDELHQLDKITFVSTGGGAMLELLANGTLPSIEALN